MWMLMGLMGLLMASSMADAFMRFENGNRGAEDDDGVDDPTGLDPELADGAALARGDLLAGAGQGAESGQDPWLDEWRDDAFVSTDDDGSDDGDDTGQMPLPPAPDLPPPDMAPVPDPWLDGWRDDSYTSSDDAPDEAEPGDGSDPVPDPGPDTPDPVAPDPWLDGWRDDSYVSSDIPADLAALAGGAQAVHVLGAGDVFDTGGGAGAFVIGDWIGDGAPALVQGFDPDADRLIFAFDAALGPPQISVLPGDDSTPAVLMVDAQPVLSLAGVQTLDAGSVLLYPIRLDG